MSTAGGITQVIRKRANKEQLIAALRSIIHTPIRYENSGIVYRLRDLVDGLPAVVKIIYTGRRGVTTVKIRSERRYLHNVEQLHGCVIGSANDEQYYYLIMPYIVGVPFEQTGLSLEKAKELMIEAQNRYRHQFCLLLM